MTRLASAFSTPNMIRKDRPLTDDELRHYVPSIFSQDKHDSRSDRYTWIPTITLLNRIRHEGFEPFFACQQRIRDPCRTEHAKHMLRLRRYNQISHREMSEIILLNSRDGSSSYQMISCSNRREHNGDDLWTVYQRTQENVIRGGQSGRTAKGQRTRTINGIDGDIQTNRFLWSLSEKMKELKT